MAIETELKLLIQADQVALLVAHPLLSNIANEQNKQQRLRNCYYDTPQFDLRNHRVALRIRQTPDSYIQTLKTGGSRDSGLSRRNEWEWQLESAHLDLDLLQAPDWPLDERVKTTLVPCFNTDFDRQTWWLKWQGETSGEIEVALDIGQISASGRQLPICELELELKAGDESVLQEVAAVLAETIALTPSDISKAQRGYQLMGHEQ